MYGSGIEQVNYADLLQRTYTFALEKNINAQIHWKCLKQDYCTLETVLKDLPRDLKKDVMVPVAPKALMRGIIVHTNEILVCLGDGYFVRRSSSQAVEICKRREKICSDMLDALEKEQRLLRNRSELPLCQQAFGGGTEIMEEYDEEKEATWREEHRRKEHEHRSRLAELRQKESTAISDEESLWKRLDELELQEELEEELDRLNADRDSDDEEEEELVEEDIDDDKEVLFNSRKNNAQQPIAVPPECEASTQPEAEEQRVPRRRVSFVEGDRGGDEASAAEETAELRITFSHSACQSSPPVEEGCGDGPPRSPADIYLRFSSASIAPRRSILKKHSVYGDGDGDGDVPEQQQQQQQRRLSEDEGLLPLLLPISDAVVERQATVSQSNATEADSTRPISRFKEGRRLKKK